jgi:hypothetical protein
MQRTDMVIWQPQVDAVAATLRWRDIAYHAQPAARRRVQPFLVVTSTGLAQRDSLLAELALRRIYPQGPTVVSGWPAAATRLFVRRRSLAHLASGAAYERLWRAAGETAEVWRLADVRDYVRLLQEKNGLRALFPGDAHELHVHLPGVRFASTAHLHAFHVPDPQNLATETWLLGARSDEARGR